MNVIRFDIAQGIYITELNNLNSDFHSHPALEMILAEEGVFDLSLENGAFKALKFAVIATNVVHKLSLSESKVTVLLIEYRDNFIQKFLSENNSKLKDGYFVSTDSKDDQFFKNFLEAITSQETLNEYDPRVRKIIDYLNQNSVSYFDLKKDIKSFVFLSDSRLSHLFKQNLGVSLKNYFVWCNLKHSVNDHLQKNDSLMNALLSNGFYDQPHFTNAYKSFVGAKPAKIYNSRILQAMPKRMK